MGKEGQVDVRVDGKCRAWGLRSKNSTYLLDLKSTECKLKRTRKRSGGTLEKVVTMSLH